MTTVIDAPITNFKNFTERDDLKMIEKQTVINKNIKPKVTVELAKMNAEMSSVVSNLSIIFSTPKMEF